MIFFLILGILIGVLSIIFILQNIVPVTVAFFAYHVTGSLSIILFLALIAGMLISIFILLPSFIRDEFRINKLKKQNQDLLEELSQQKTVILPDEPLI